MATHTSLKPKSIRSLILFDVMNLGIYIWVSYAYTSSSSPLSALLVERIAFVISLVKKPLTARIRKRNRNSTMVTCGDTSILLMWSNRVMIMQDRIIYMGTKMR